VKASRADPTAEDANVEVFQTPGRFMNLVHAHKAFLLKTNRARIGDELALIQKRHTAQTT
jgi:hypothetical protein